MSDTHGYHAPEPAGYLMPEGHDFTNPLSVVVDDADELILAFDAKGRVIYRRADFAVTRITVPDADRDEDPRSDARAERIIQAIQDHLDRLDAAGPGMTDDSTPLPVQLHMTGDDFSHMSESSAPWGVWQISDIEDGRYEPVDDDRDTVRLDWTTVHYVRTSADLILAKSYLRTLGEPFEVLYDTEAVVLSEDGEPVQTFPEYLLLTSYGDRDYWLGKSSCTHCNTPSGRHFEGCPNYADDKAKHPAMARPMPLEWRGRTTATIGG